jgi:hypothetical protein
MLAGFMLFAACLSIVLMPVPAGASLQQSRQPVRQQEPENPDMPYWHVWTDENGVSHQDRCTMSNFEYSIISSGAAPLWIDRMSVQPAHIIMLKMPVGWVGEWHENPEPQWIVPLSGRWFVETMDGKRVEMGPGELSFGNDQNTKPDARGHTGHRSGAVGDQPAVLMLVQVKQDPVNSRPCQLK